MHYRRIPAVMAILWCAVWWSATAQASLIFVDTLDDELNSDGDCSLREAVAAANQNMPVDDCETGQSVQTDSIFILLAGEIQLTSPLVITDRVTITGGGRETLTLRSDPNYLVSLIKVDMSNPDHDFELTDLTLRDGGARPDSLQYCCGALQLAEGDKFTIKDVAFLNNQTLIENSSLWWTGGGAIHAGPLLNSPTASLTIEDSLFENNSAAHGNDTLPGQVGFGGAIFALERYGTEGETLTLPLASLNIKRSEFRGNAAGRGGSALAIQGDTVVSISDSLFEDNLDPWDNAAYNYSGGTLYLWLYSVTPSYIRSSSFVRNATDDLRGTIYINDGTVIIDNSTFYGNNSPPLEASNQAIVAVNYSTLANNGYGASLVGNGTATFQMRGSIVWHDKALSAECDFAGGVSYTSLGHNIDSGFNCTPHATDLQTTDPQLAPLDYYGDTVAGFDLPTLLPDPGGPAVDGAQLDDCNGSLGGLLTTDQRGVPRPVDGAESGADLCDIGAVEYQFEEDPEFSRLTVDFMGTGEGHIVDNKERLDCTDDCSATYIQQTQVRLTATPNPNHEFTGWGGACSGSGQCLVTLSINRTVTATFQPIPANGPIFSDGFEDLPP